RCAAIAGGGGLFGVGFWVTQLEEARHDSSKLKWDNTFRFLEVYHVSPSGTVSVEHPCWQAIPTPEQADGGVLGLLEPGHDPGGIVLVDRRRLGLGADREREVQHRAGTAPRSVPRSSRQGGTAARATRSGSPALSVMRGFSLANWRS